MNELLSLRRNVVKDHSQEPRSHCTFSLEHVPIPILTAREVQTWGFEQVLQASHESKVQPIWPWALEGIMRRDWPWGVMRSCVLSWLCRSSGADISPRQLLPQQHACCRRDSGHPLPHLGVQGTQTCLINFHYCLSCECLVFSLFIIIVV